MRSMTVDELRQSYLEFFQSKGHKRLPSASLVPHGDPTLLLTAAGMVPFKPYFIGSEAPPASRVTTCQRCLRTPDIENVGITDRHATFFEMLGNFSFGDYFKRDAIKWAWEFATEILQVDPNLLWVTIYLDDDEAFSIWHDEVHVPAERIVRLGKKDNFWGIGVGPCGPCSEIHIDRGPQHGCGQADCKPGCDCERFMELWNLVFVQYHQDEDGALHPLKHPGIDTGMGLERVAAMLQGKKSIFEIDLIHPIVDYVASAAGIAYGATAKGDTSLRVIADHMRGVTFMVLDGILPSNEGRGYILRRLLRRAVRHARLLGIERNFLAEMVDVIITQMQTGYPEVAGKAGYIRKVVETEERRFQETLDQGMEILEKILRNAEQQSTGISGADAFRLHDTFGFPLELTEEIAADRGIQVDKEAFATAMEQQRERARAARTDMGYLGGDEKAAQRWSNLPATEFVGYTALQAGSEILAIGRGDELVGRLSGSGQAELVLAATPFYAEGGGQVTDTGVITVAGGSFTVQRVFRANKGVIVHKGVFTGDIQVGEEAQAAVAVSPRRATQRNHTATHLLHKALHLVLGEHANQAGSLVDPERLRFDFTHYEAVSATDLLEIERLVNQSILENMPVNIAVLAYDQALAAGATALFGEKYGDQVRVVSISDYSKELCGGTHVAATGEIGLFRIMSEGSVASGVRRIEAVTGENAWKHVVEESEVLAAAAERLQVAPRDLLPQLEKLLGQLKAAERNTAALRASLAGGQVAQMAAWAESVEGIHVLAANAGDVDRSGLLNLGDQLKEKLGDCVLALAAVDAGKMQLIVTASDKVVAQGLNAATIIRKVYGSGGGRPQMAQAGGKAPADIAELLAQFKREIMQNITQQVVKQR